MDVTDEMLGELAAVHEAARRAYWEALGHDTGTDGMTAAEHERVAQRQAMAAVLAVVERDYVVLPRGAQALCCGVHVDVTLLWGACPECVAGDGDTA